MAEKSSEELKIYRIFETLENRSALFCIVAGILSIGLLGAIDFLTGNEVTFSLFYLAPIALVTWCVNQNAGLLMSFLSALTLLGAEIEAGQTYSHPYIYILNTLIRAMFYVIVTYLVAQLQTARREEQFAARTDFVTGVINRRYFNELLKMEVDRSRRYPHQITMVYMDIDNFKLVNDLFGHQIGDEVLRCIADELKSQLRITDFIARLGGDEFALLLPSTSQSQAEMVVSKVHEHLREEMKRRNLPVTFSMGSVTCATPPYSAEQLIKLADEVMYKVKNSTKDNACFITWGSENSGSY
ncbi:MAG TPA: GGDEF domain-containing protein [Anaerolineales bacterium]|nr:GGDEF domain-containing protein [Anaerolineales bacterium]